MSSLFFPFFSNSEEKRKWEARESKTVRAREIASPVCLACMCDWMDREIWRQSAIKNLPTNFPILLCHEADNTHCDSAGKSMWQHIWSEYWASHYGTMYAREPILHGRVRNRALACIYVCLCVCAHEREREWKRRNRAFACCLVRFECRFFLLP